MDNISVIISGLTVVLSVVSVFKSFYSVFTTNDKNIKLENHEHVIIDERKKKSTADVCIRVFDFMFAIFGLIVMMPIIVMVSIALKLNSKESVFVKIKKIGKNGKEVNIYGFRTDNNNELDSLNVFLIKTGIKNLPQFFNVLRGELSIYGLAQIDVKMFKDAKEEISKFDCAYNYYRPGVVSLSSIEKYDGQESYYSFLNQANIKFVNNRGFKLMFKMVKHTLNLIFCK